MEVCDGSAILAYAVTCSEVRQLRNEEAVSDAEAMERWLGDRGKSNFEKMWILFRLPRFGTRMCFAPCNKKKYPAVCLTGSQKLLAVLSAGELGAGDGPRIISSCHCSSKISSRWQNLPEQERAYGILLADRSGR